VVLLQFAKDIQDTGNRALGFVALGCSGCLHRPEMNDPGGNPVLPEDGSHQATVIGFLVKPDDICVAGNTLVLAAGCHFYDRSLRTAELKRYLIAQPQIIREDQPARLFYRRQDWVGAPTPDLLALLSRRFGPDGRFAPNFFHRGSGRDYRHTKPHMQQVRVFWYTLPVPAIKLPRRNSKDCYFSDELGIRGSSEGQFREKLYPSPGWTPFELRLDRRLLCSKCFIDSMIDGHRDSPGFGGLGAFQETAAYSSGALGRYSCQRGPFIRARTLGESGWD
jgi:hypothetical protein